MRIGHHHVPYILSRRTDRLVCCIVGQPTGQATRRVILYSIRTNSTI